MSKEKEGEGAKPALKQLVEREGFMTWGKEEMTDESARVLLDTVKEAVEASKKKGVKK